LPVDEPPDVVGDDPNSVVYNDGVQDLLVWVPQVNTVKSSRSGAACDAASALR